MPLGVSPGSSIPIHSEVSSPVSPAPLLPCFPLREDSQKIDPQRLNLCCLGPCAALHDHQRGGRLPPDNLKYIQSPRFQDAPHRQVEDWHFLIIYGTPDALI